MDNGLVVNYMFLGSTLVIIFDFRLDQKLYNRIYCKFYCCNFWSLEDMPRFVNPRTATTTARGGSRHSRLQRPAGQARAALATAPAWGLGTAAPKDGSYSASGWGWAPKQPQVVGATAFLGPDWLFGPKIVLGFLGPLGIRSPTSSRSSQYSKFCIRW